MELLATIDSQALEADVKNFAKQVRFALSVALYETARACAEGVKDNLDKHFIKRTPWIYKGIWVEPGGSRAIRKAAGDTGPMIAKVGTVDEFMARHALGGKKTARGKAMGVPVAIRDPITKVLRPSKWPSALLKDKTSSSGARVKRRRKKPFIQQLSNGKNAILIRTSKKRYPLKTLYTFEKEVDIQKRWPFKEEMERLAPSIFEERFESAMKRALETAK